MELILWRHAEAEEGTPDSTRKLTAKGKKQAQLMAEWLKPRLPEHTRIIVLTVAGWPQAKDAVLVVGHQPTLGEVASLLMSGVPEGWSMRKSAVWWFSNTKKGLSADLVLRTVISPDML